MGSALLGIIGTLLVSMPVHPPPDELLRAIEIKAFIDAHPTVESALQIVSAKDARVASQQAPVVVLGSYHQGAYPCIPGRGGLLRRPLACTFKVHKVYRGRIRPSSVDIRCAVGAGDPRLIDGRPYLVILRPTPATTETLADPLGRFNLNTAIGREEIVAVVELPPPTP